MGAGGTFRNGRDFAQKFKADMKALTNRLDGALDRGAQRAADQARERAPSASGFLRESIHAVGLRVVVDAPYAIYVEQGARPHWPPIEPLIAWVRLRGFVGMGSSAGSQDPAVSIAWAIATKISREGVQPTWFMRGTIPATVRFIGLEVKAALRA